MDLGAILDYCNEWNEAHDVKAEGGKPKIRDATQEDIDKFLG